ncbi:hypothetical protein NQ317_014099 [Molorchus minor]|uniref:Uncharacterized protein n=1 Tax=Molorchus minor TaxID=1323400 RepID=A0ABQ9IUZ2_9CUCU|nr:hypothetical protein NQ317_014099 [Molorchus minor]
MAGCGSVWIYTSSGGMLILFDSDRVILSKLLSTTEQFYNLPHPLLYYIAIGISLLGLVPASTGILVGVPCQCLFFLLGLLNGESHMKMLRLTNKSVR